MNPRVIVCGVQVPFETGGAEVLTESLKDELVRRGVDATIVTLPFVAKGRVQLLEAAFAWRMLDLTEVNGKPVDLVIATRFPSYAVRHPNKVVWLVHQLRQIYDLAGTPYSDFTDDTEDRQTSAMLKELDRRCLGEARRRYAISGNVASRLARYSDLDALPLYPPPRHGFDYRSGEHGDYVLSVSRLDEAKRVDLLVQAIARTARPVRALVVGQGPQEGRLRALAAELSVADRVELLGRVPDESLLDLYAGALAVYYAPYDEDYGYVTVEAFRSKRPVVTASDSGGVLELVDDGTSGLVTAPTPSDLARSLDRLFDDRPAARRMGEAGYERVREIGWDKVVDRLLSTL